MKGGIKQKRQKKVCTSLKAEIWEVITEMASLFNEKKTMETPSIRTNFPYSLATHSVMKTFAIDLDG